MKAFKRLSMFLVLFFIISCSDSEKKCKPICVNGKIRECVDDKLTDAKDCEDNKICITGKCVKQEDCTKSTCVNGKLKECKNGKYLEIKDCNKGEICKDGECQSLVIEGDCVYDSCSIDAKMKVPCNNLKKGNPIACEGDKRCLFGKCSSLPEIGSSCDEKDFLLRCLDDSNVLVCNNKKVELKNCELYTGLKGSTCQVQKDLGVGACVEDRVSVYEKSSCNGNIIYEWNKYTYVMEARECSGEFDICVEKNASASCSKSCDINSPVICSENNKPMTCVAYGEGSYLLEKESSTACINNKIYSCEVDGLNTKLTELSCDDGICAMSSNPMVLAQAKGKFVCKIEENCEYGTSRCSASGDVEICTGKAWERIGCKDGESCVLFDETGAMCAKEVEAGNLGIGCENVDHIFEDGSRSSVNRFYEYLKNNGKYYELTAGYGNSICYQGGIYECSNQVVGVPSNQCPDSKICNPMSDLDKTINLTRCVDSCSDIGNMSCDNGVITRCENVQGKKVLIPSYSSDFHSTLTNAICAGDGTKIYTCDGNELKEVACNNLDCNQGMEEKNGEISCSSSCQNGESYCDGEEIKECENGFWVSKSLCVGDKTCVKYEDKAICTPSCNKESDGENAKCNGNYFIQCVEIDGKDVWSNFSSRCNGNNLETCMNSNLVSVKCEDNYTCHNGSCQAPKCKNEMKTCLEGGKYHARCNSDGDYIVEACEYIDGKSSAQCHNNVGCYTSCEPSNITSLGVCVQHNSAIEICNSKGEVEKITCPSGQTCTDADFNAEEFPEAFCL